MKKLLFSLSLLVSLISSTFGQHGIWQIEESDSYFIMYQTHEWNDRYDLSVILSPYHDGLILSLYDKYVDEMVPFGSDGDKQMIVLKNDLGSKIGVSYTGGRVFTEEMTYFFLASMALEEAVTVRVLIEDEFIGEARISWVGFERNFDKLGEKLETPSSQIGHNASIQY